MKEKTTEVVGASSHTWDALEAVAHAGVQRLIDR